MEFQLSDAVLQSIFEPIIVTDGKGHMLKVNQAAAELLGEAATDRMALANTPGGDKILSAIRDAVSMQKAVATEDEAAMLPMRIGKQERSYRLRTTPMRDSEGRLLGTVTTLEDVTSLQDTDRFKTQFISVASRKLRDPLLQLRRGLYALGQGFGGELLPLQAELVAAASNESREAGRSDERSDRSGRAGCRQARVQAGTAAALAGAERGPRPFLRRGRAQKHIRVEVNAYADLSFVQADRRALRSILDNLLSNAHSLHAGGWRDSAGRRRGQGLCAVHGARHRPRHRGRTAEHHLRPLQSILGERLRTGPGAGAAAGGVAGRPDRRREPAGPWNHLPLYSSRGGGGTVRHPVEVG